MRSVLIEGPGQVSVLDAEVPEPAPGQVRIRVELIGICATDLHILHGSYPQAAYPVRPGHEITGVVDRLGDGVTSVSEGDHVVVDPGVPCGVCRSCRDGRPNLCENRRAIGVSLSGGAAEFVTVPAGNLHRFSADVPVGARVLGEPLACVVHALDLVGPISGRDILIYGAGTIGLLALQVAVHDGAGTVTVVDRIESRLGLARRGGATLAAVSASDVAIDGWEVVIDATGAPAAIVDGLDRVRSGGTFMQVGVAPPDAVVAIAPYRIYARELTIRGSMTTRHSFPRAIGLLESGAIDSELFTAEPFALEDYALAISRSGTGEVPKVTVSPTR